MSDDYEIRFRCTDRDSHPSRELLIIGRFVDGGKEHRSYLARIATGRKPPYEWGKHPLYVPSHREGKRPGDDGWAVWNGNNAADGGPGLWRLVCPTCNRDTQWRSENLVQIMDTLHAAGVSTVNISKLPVK